MLTPEMITLITNHRAGMVASIREDGTPAVSPKATFVVLDNKTLAYGNIRSPGTNANLRKRPAVEVCFIDVVTRKAVRVTGEAEVIAKAGADDRVLKAFQTDWADYLDHMTHFVVINITDVEFILSPGYDLGFTEAELTATNMTKLKALYDDMLEAQT